MLIIMFEGKRCRPSDLGLFVPEGGHLLIGRRRVKKEGPLIMLRTDMYECQVKATLLHEMNHADTNCDHGSRWLKGMRRLAREGAFDKLW
jgi:hypothetical protein